LSCLSLLDAARLASSAERPSLFQHMPHLLFSAGLQSLPPRSSPRQVVPFPHQRSLFAKCRVFSFFPLCAPSPGISRSSQAVHSLTGGTLAHGTPGYQLVVVTLFFYVSLHPKLKKFPTPPLRTCQYHFCSGAPSPKCCSLHFPPPIGCQCFFSSFPLGIRVTQLPKRINSPLLV